MTPKTERQALLEASDRIEEAQRLHDELRASGWMPRRPTPPAGRVIEDDRAAIMVAVLGFVAVLLVSLAAAVALLLPAVLP